MNDPGTLKKNEISEISENLPSERPRGGTPERPGFRRSDPDFGGAVRESPKISKFRKVQKIRNIAKN